MVLQCQSQRMYNLQFLLLIFISGFRNGDVIRSGMTWHRGQGKIFYFRPGHETYPTFYNPNVLKIIRNAISWAKK